MPLFLADKICPRLFVLHAASVIPDLLKAGAKWQQVRIEKSERWTVYFRLKAGNGETILSSEMYKARASAEHGIESVKKNAPDDARYERKETKTGQHMFNLKAANHEIIGTSESYTTGRGTRSWRRLRQSKCTWAAIDDQSA